MWSHEALSRLADSLDSNPGIIRVSPVGVSELTFDMLWFNHPAETMPSPWQQQTSRVDERWLQLHENFRRLYGRWAVATALGHRINVREIYDYGMGLLQALERELEELPLDRAARTPEEWDEAMLLIAHHTVAYANQVLFGRMLGNADRLQGSALLLNLRRQQAEFSVELLTNFPQHYGVPSTQTVNRIIDFIGEVATPSGLARLAADAE